MSALRLKNILIIPFFLFGIALLVVGCSQSQSGRKILYYANPMVPTDHSDKPKKDPMGMDYVPVYEDEVNQDTEATAENEQTDQKNGEVAGYVPVKITPEKQQLIGVKYGVVERKELTKHIQTVGKVAHETEIYNLQQEYFSALKYYQDAKKSGSNETINAAALLLNSAAFKLKLQGFSQAQIDALNSKGSSDLSLLLNEGQNSSWVDIQVYEIDLEFVKAGQTVKISIPARPGEMYSGKIVTIDPVLNTETRTTRARVLMNNKSLPFKHEVYVNAEIEVPMGKLLAIPVDAVIDTGVRQMAFVARENGTFEPRQVTVGRLIGEYYELLSGVEDGERVVTAANFLIDSESQLKAAMKQM